MDPEIILFDEPTSALDPTMVGEVEKVIQSLCGKGYTILLVTHDMKFAEKVSTRILFLCDGGVYEDGTPDQIFHHPQKQKTIEFINQSKEFECVITEEDGEDSFPEFYTKIDQFTFNNGLDEKIKERVQGLFEEIVFQVLIPEHKKRTRDNGVEDKYEIRFHVSHSTRGEGTIVEIDAEKMDVDIDEEYLIQRRLIEYSASDIRFEDKDNGMGKMTIKVREDAVNREKEEPANP
ncbi:MAG: hypothetical protein Q4E54_03600 [Lachnospiraceae bacterium]|nr:hypothetical protein [Lachnospiraceae bacterium]